MPDIKMNRRSSLREILREEPTAPKKQEDSNLPPRDPYAAFGPKRGSAPKYLILGGLVIIALVAIFAFSTMFAQATIEVSPRQGKLLLDNNFESYRIAQTEGELVFSVVSEVTDTEKKTVPATGTETVSKKASGTITIYNSYDEKPQKLVATTRFQTADGRIYRIQEAITVPGMKAGAPGTVDAVVVADEAGDKFNLESGDFKVPGFEGTPQYDKFSAKTKTPISGGFVGEVKKVSPADKEKARAELQGILKDRIVEKAKVQIPEEFVLFDGAYFITYEEVPTVSSGGSANEAEVVEKATFHGLLFNKRDFARYVAQSLIPNFGDQDVEIVNMQELKFTLIDGDKITSPAIDKLSFNLQGNAHLAWVFDQENLISNLRIAPGGDYQAVFAQIPAIEKGSVSFRPPWIRSIPDDKEKIKVEIILEN